MLLETQVIDRRYPLLLLLLIILLLLLLLSTTTTSSSHRYGNIYSFSILTPIRATHIPPSPYRQPGPRHHGWLSGPTTVPRHRLDDGVGPLRRAAGGRVHLRPRGEAVQLHVQPGQHSGQPGGLGLPGRPGRGGTEKPNQLRLGPEDRYKTDHP